MEALPPRLARDLARRAAHPHDPSARTRVTWVQTHLSHVFLTRDFVYKLRKAVHFDFVDFSTRARRNADCVREVVLNRRLAPRVYLGIARIESTRGRFRLGATQADAESLDARFEHAVVMRRLPAGRDAASLLLRGALRPADLEAVAERLARFHAAHGLGRPSPWSRLGWLDHVQGPLRDTLEQLESEAGDLIPRKLWATARERAQAFAHAHSGAFEARRRAGRAVDGHGDVHLQHVWFEAGASEPILVDCLEFNADLRRIDVASEVAFLAMDLAYRGRRRLADRFLAAYARCADDFDLFRVVDYFIGHRAAVRARVAAIAARDPAIARAQRGAAAASARRHLALTARALAPREPGAVVITAGVVGTGKSTAAAIVADTLGGVVLASDALRKRLRGMATTDRSGAAADLYSDAARDRVYAALLERAAPVIESGRVAVLDATYARARQRHAVARFARGHGIALWIVETRAPRAITLARLARRERRADSASDAGPARLAGSVAEFEPVRAPRAAHRVVRTDVAGWRAALRRAARAWRRAN